MMSPAFLTAALAMASVVAAFPGMGTAMSDFEKRQRAPSSALIGDLQGLPDENLTKTGRDIMNILRGSASGERFDQRFLNPPKGSKECVQDGCCIWKHIADDMRSTMSSGLIGCNDVARGAIRLGFHDAATWSRGTGKKGGADGSILLAGECETRTENLGLAGICTQTRVWFDKYKKYGIGMADLIQMGANVGTAVCTGGPRVRTFVGRKDSSEPSPEGLLPLESSSADVLISLFENKTISAAGLVALVGAHSTSRQRFVDPERAGEAQDSTPDFWDTAFYRQTVLPDALVPRRVFRFQSDVNLATDPRTSGTWGLFGAPIAGQLAWNPAYAREYVRLSLLGVYNINDLTECTEVLPGIIPV